MIENVLAAIVCVELIFGGFAGWLIKVYLEKKAKGIHQEKRKQINFNYTKQKEGYNKWKHINSY